LGYRESKITGNKFKPTICAEGANQVEKELQRALDSIGKALPIMIALMIKEIY
jgi:hypothetical protein